MIKTTIAALALSLAMPVFAADEAAKTEAAPTTEQVITQFREDLQAKRADIMAKGLTLTAEQAAKFWPAFEQFQKEQSTIMDAQFKAMQKYGSNFDKITDADATEYVNALLARDAKVQALRVKWLAKFQKIVPAKTAARAIQLDRRLGLVGQIDLSARMPLVR